jgi:pyruvate dehydrogenase E2 component (dihydrolipoamide acetyltransferase)
MWRLAQHPRVNTTWTDKATKIAKTIHIGVAVAVEDGLLVPVLPFADQMSMQQIGVR